MKKYVIFAGVNGAGKTTLYQTNKEYLDIRRRYDESLNNLKDIISLCHRVRIYDNTNKFGIVAIFNNGICVDRIDDIPDWCKGIV